MPLSERFNRTLQESFFDYHEDLLFTDLAAFNQKLADWLVFYNTQRPHYSLGQISPVSFLLQHQPECQRYWTHTFGTRLYPLTKTCPKPMLKVGGKPILELILEGFANAGFHRFFISTHYLPEIIKEHFGDGSNWRVSITYIDEVEPLGTGGALGLLPQEQIDLPLIVMNGDILTRIDFRSLHDFHAKQGSAATMCVREHQHQVPYGMIESNESRLTSFIEKPIHRYFINAGVYVLSPETVKRVPPHTRIDMPDVLASVMSNQQIVSVFPIHESWLDIGRMDDFERAHEHLTRSDT